MLLHLSKQLSFGWCITLNSIKNKFIMDWLKITIMEYQI